MLRVITRKKMCIAMAEELDLISCDTCSRNKISPVWCYNNCDESLNRWCSNASTEAALMHAACRISTIVEDDYPNIKK